MDEVSVTVLMAVYNGGEYLKQCVESILGQTHENFEFLIINDCSTDDSLQTLESFHDERIKIHNNTRNLGQTASLNIGLKLAKGDYFARIDSDDVALPRWLEAQISFIERYSGYSIISSYVIAIDEKNKIKKVYKSLFDREEIILRSLISPPMHHVSSIYNTKDIIEIGGYDEQYIYAADYELFNRGVRNNFKMTTNPEILVAIREHGYSVSRSEHGRRDLEEIKEIAGRNINEFTHAGLSEAEISLFCRANYDEGNLTADEFNKAVEVTKRVYMNLTPSLNVKNGKRVQWMRQYCMTIYLKRIFYCVDRKDYCAARKLSLMGIKEFGPLGIFIILWTASLFGGMVLSFIPGLYHKILRRKARFQLGFQSGIGIFH